MVTRRFALACVLTASCADTVPVFNPIIDVPTNDTASAFPMDSLTVSIAHEGSELDLVSATFSKGEAIAIPNVPYADDLVVHMTGRIGTNEVAYGRTCKFSMRADGRPPEPHLYFSRIVKFGALALRPLARTNGMALTYNDGSGLLLGGTNPNDPTDSIEQVERFDPNTGEYETLHDLQPRLGAAVATLGAETDAQVVVLGGIDTATNAGAEFVELLDAKGTTERQYQSFFEPSMARVGLTATTLSSGEVVVIGGRAPNGASASVVTRLRVDSGTVDVGAFGAPNSQLVHPRYNHTATRLEDDLGAPVLVAGGLDDMGNPVAAAELFKPLREAFSDTFDRSMVVPRYGHRAVALPDGSVLILGGFTKDAQGAIVPVTEIEQFTLDSGFKSVGALPATAGVIDASVTVLADGRVLYAGGRLVENGDPVTSAFIVYVDRLTAQIQIGATDRLLVPRAGHQATLLCDGTVLIAGGTADQTTYERYNPSANSRR